MIRKLYATLWEVYCEVDGTMKMIKEWQLEVVHQPDIHYDHDAHVVAMKEMVKIAEAENKKVEMQYILDEEEDLVLE